MKNFSICFLMLFILSASFAQETEKILEKKAANSFPLTFEDYNRKNLEVEWKKFVKLFGVKAKKNRDTKEFFAKNVLIKEISPKPMDIYATVFKNKKTSILTVWFSVDGVFIDPRIHKVESAVINQLLNDFSSIAIFNENQRQAQYASIAKENSSNSNTTNTSTTTKVKEPEKIASPQKTTGGCHSSSAPIED